MDDVTNRSWGEWLRWAVWRVPRRLRHGRTVVRWWCVNAVNAVRLWWELRVQRRPISDITRYERHLYSQNGEDGILEALFAVIGTTNQYFVEFGASDAKECNARYLAQHRGWRGLWMDADCDHPHRAVRRETVTAENVEALFARYGVPRTFDLLSIDIDGNDYWVWRAITAYEPRVVVIEYNAMVPLQESRVIPYDPLFRWDANTDFFGASLLALQRLGAQKGYALVGCDRSGTNAFFVRRTLIPGRLLLQDVAAVYRRSMCFNGRGFPHNRQHQMVQV